MAKPDSLYNKGMKVLMYSKIGEVKEKQGWHRVGQTIAYYHNQIVRKGSGYYTLTFTVESKYEKDEVYISADYPYTYSHLMKRIKKWCSNKNRHKVQFIPLCKTLAGNILPMLVITNFSSNEESISVRPAIVLTARVHPG